MVDKKTQFERKLKSISISAAVKWLRENLCPGSLNIKTEVSLVLAEVKKGIKNPSLSNRALGMAVRRAFPAVSRRKIGAVHYYCGVKFISTGVGTTSFCKSAIDVQIPEAQQIKNEACCLQSKNANSKLVPQTTSKHTTMTSINRGSTGGCQQHRKHDITSINISLSELQATDEDQILGEGTFAKCILGTYKGIQVAVKFFKGMPSWKTVHNEANIMLKIPSHPGIPMFIGLFTLHYPYLLVTKFHQYSGKSITYSDFLKHSKKTQNNVLYHLLSTLLDAIMHLHQSGILHNDIKGNNVLVEKSNRQKRCILIDFGKACTLQESKGSSKHKLMSQSQREEYRQRFPHVAPEICRGVMQDVKSDTYSFGYLYCTTLKVQGETKSALLKLGQRLTHWNPEKRPDLLGAKEELNSYI